MKANQKLRRGDDAVSPVIAVILMVAITVVLAATVYVWVSGFGTAGNVPPRSVAFASGGTLQTGLDMNDAGDNAADDHSKLYIVTAAAPGLRYSDVAFTLNGAPAVRSAGNCDATLTDLLPSATAGSVGWIACPGALSASGGSAKAADALVMAGDHVYVLFEAGSAPLAGQTLRVLDPAANSIIATLVVG